MMMMSNTDESNIYKNMKKKKHFLTDDIRSATPNVQHTAAPTLATILIIFK